MFTGAESDALMKILQKPYWSRVWVIQEICVAKALRIHSGHQSVPWDDFLLVLVMMERCMPWFVLDLDSNFRALLELRRLRHEEKSAPHPQLADILSQFRWSKATNPRDKIYGLLGLAQSRDRDVVKIEYKKSPEECYTQAMFALLDRSRDLGLLIDCNVPSFVHRQPCERRRLPSWVPDWSYDASHLPPPSLGLSEHNPYHRLRVTKEGIYRSYQATNNSECPTPKLRDSPDGAVLTLHGMTAARITQVAPAIELHHQLLRIANHRGIYVPVPPFTWGEFTAKVWVRMLWRILKAPSIEMLVVFPWNCYRKGAALDVLLHRLVLPNLPEHG
jgi:hypothetical protein